MCGRFTNRFTWRELVELYRLTGQAPPSNFQPRYNIAPTQNSFVVRRHDDGRQLARLRWGLIPFWSKDAKGASRMINAQSEFCAVKPAFRSAFKSRRCLVVADGFYEWPERDKPRLITTRDSAPFAFAGLWESWAPKDGERLETFTILTCRPNSFMEEIHDRMPVMLSPEVWGVWLGETGAGADELQSLCRPFPADQMISWRVTARVGNVRHDDAELVSALAETEAAQPALLAGA